MDVAVLDVDWAGITYPDVLEDYQGLVTRSNGNCPIDCGFGFCDLRLHVTHAQVIQQTTLRPPMMWYLQFREDMSRVDPACNSLACSVRIISLVNW